jgi:hypothetical protein
LVPQIVISTRKTIASIVEAMVLIAGKTVPTVARILFVSKKILFALKTILFVSKTIFFVSEDLGPGIVKASLIGISGS